MIFINKTVHGSLYVFKTEEEAIRFSRISGLKWEFVARQFVEAEAVRDDVQAT